MVPRTPHSMNMAQGKSGTAVLGRESLGVETLDGSQALAFTPDFTPQDGDQPSFSMPPFANG